MAHEGTGHPLILRYDRPAAEWNEALPIGNGRLGAMVFGHPSEDVLQLNEDSLWHGGPRNRNNPDAARVLPEIRRLIFAGKPKEAERLALSGLSGMPETQRHYEPLGRLLITFGRIRPEEVSEYRRELDLTRAAARTTFRHRGVLHRRECFASFPDQAIVVRLGADRAGALSFVARLERARWRYVDETGRQGQNTIYMRGVTGGQGGIAFAAAVRVTVDGGTLEAMGEELIVEGADGATLVISASTNYREADPLAHALSRVREAGARPYSELLARHLADYQPLFNRVSLDLGGDPALRALTVPERLERLRGGADDPALAALYFQYGRYLLIASSRPGSLPANLQGIWNDQFLPPWDSKYTININTQMNYWPAETCALTECHEPLFDLIERMRGPGRETARSMYGCRGFCAHHNTDLWGDTAPQDRWLPASYWPMGAAWLCLHLWEHYRFTLDLAFLRQALETMKEAALFLLDYLVESPGGEWVTCPSVSPENAYVLPDGQIGVLCAGPSMDTQIIRALFGACLEAGRILAERGAVEPDAAFTRELERMLEKLPRDKIGRLGTLQEWMEDYGEAEPGHRHISHLFALHPGDQITPRKTPELAEAARRTLERRLAHGGGHTGWSRAWIINLWARLGEGREAHGHLRALLASSTLPNLLDDHPPFQIDGNFGATAGIAEMLLQSHDEAIHLLPALPDAWTAGVVKGLRARGGYEVAIRWSEGRLREAVIVPRYDGMCTVRAGERFVVLDGDGESVPVTETVLPGGLGESRFPVRAAACYRIRVRTDAESNQNR